MHEKAITNVKDSNLFYDPFLADWTVNKMIATVNLDTFDEIAMDFRPYFVYFAYSTLIANCDKDYDEKFGLL